MKVCAREVNTVQANVNKVQMSGRYNAHQRHKKGLCTIQIDLTLMFGSFCVAETAGFKSRAVLHLLREVAGSTRYQGSHVKYRLTLLNNVMKQSNVHKPCPSDAVVCVGSGV